MFQGIGVEIIQGVGTDLPDTSRRPRSRCLRRSRPDPRTGTPRRSETLGPPENTRYNTKYHPRDMGLVKNSFKNVILYGKIPLVIVYKSFE